MYALVDGNSFYCSCERVFNPALVGKPVVVLSNNDGCAIAMSDEAKKAGVTMGTPAHMMKELIRKHDIKLCSSNYTLYGDMSRRMMNIFRRFVPRQENYSIDEAFLDMSELYQQDLLKLGMDIRKTVGRNIGIPVCVGIAPTKTLAKMANRFAKKHRKNIGVHWLANSDLINEALEATAIEDVWGIGSKHAQRLKAHGFYTAADFVRKAPADWVRKQMSVVGERMLNELKGIPSIPWDYVPPSPKNVGTSRSFGSIQTEKHIIEGAMSTHTSHCALKLRTNKLCASAIQVFIQTNPFRTADEQYFHSITLELPVPTNNTSELIAHARRGLNIIFKQGPNYHKVGVNVLDLVPETQVQTGLFDTTDREKNNRLMQIFDSINKDIGRDTVYIAAQGDKEKYQLKAEYLSRRYTTRYNELPVLKF